VSGSSLHRLDDEGGDVAGIEAACLTRLELLSKFFDTSHRVRLGSHPLGTAIGMGIRRDVRVRDERTHSRFEIRSHEGEDAHSLPVETSPEGNETCLPGRALRETERRLDGFRARGVELRAVDVRSRTMLRDHLEE